MASKKQNIVDRPQNGESLRDFQKDKELLDADPESGSIERIDDWDAPENPDNPKNWTFGKKAFHTGIPALYGFVITIGTSVYVPAIPWVMLRFNVSREIAVLPLSTYTLGLTLGPIFAAPLSELYGRQIIYRSTMTFLLIFIGISSAANSITLLILMRFLAGAGGSAAIAVGAGTIADLWDRKHAGIAALSFIISPFLGTSLGPLTGAYIIHEYNNNWRWSLWVIMVIASPVALSAIFMQETSKSRIIYLKEKKLGKIVEQKKGDTRLFLRKLRQAFIRPVHMMLIEPLVAFLSLYTGFAFAMLFSFFGSYNYVFQSIYHFNQRQIGLTFIGILIGFLFAVANFGIFDRVFYQKADRRAREREGGRADPEWRLTASMVGSLLLPVGLFWWAWAPGKDVHWIVPVLAGIPFGWGNLTIFLSATTYLVDVYGSSNSASALAANGILRYFLGAVFPLFTLQMYSGMGIHWAGTVFAFVSLAMMPVPWIFWWKGAWLRSRSQYLVDGVAV